MVVTYQLKIGGSILYWMMKSDIRLRRWNSIKKKQLEIITQMLEIQCLSYSNVFKRMYLEILCDKLKFVCKLNEQVIEKETIKVLEYEKTKLISKKFSVQKVSFFEYRLKLIDAVLALCLLYFKD